MLAFVRAFGKCQVCEPDESAEGSQVVGFPIDGVVPASFPVDSAALEAVARTRPLHTREEGLDNAKTLDHHGMHPVFEDGVVVEYYSPTHKVWLVGVVQLAVEKSQKSSGSKVFLYNIRLRKSGQVRHQVPLDMIRAPFEATELVEVFSKRNTGQWMTGTIRGPHAGGNIMRGYKVHVEEQSGVPEMLLEKVPSWRLRRRFPARSNIEVYRGPLLGWVSSVVHSVIAAFPAEPPVPLSPFSPGIADVVEGADFLPEVPGSPQITDAATEWQREDAATVCGTTVAGEDGMSVGPWMQVPVYVEEWDEDEWGHDPDMERAQWVPSYLIRMRMIKLASNKDYDRRSYMM